MLMWVKRSAGVPPPFVIPVDWPPRAVLRPVATAGALDGSPDTAALTAWRNAHVTSFLTEFEATPSRTARWLSETVGPDEGRVLFMVDSVEGVTFGYVGLSCIDWDRGQGEADSVVRGIDLVRGGMEASLRTILAWAYGHLRLQTLSVRVRSTNPRALAFYEKVGFRETGRRPLKRTPEPGMLRWVEAPQPDEHGVFLVYMRHDRGASSR
jgi:RimJ/RimL family protein N-acetyltransferase